MKLNDTKLRNLKPKDKVYRLSDGGGLYIEVMPTGRKSWYVAYALDGKRKQINIGRYPVLSLKEARERTLEVQKLVLDGIDPVENKRDQKMLRQLSHENNFESIALEWHESRKHSWKGKHGDVILGRLQTYIFPVIGRKPINEIKPYELLHAIKPIEEAGKHEMAHRMLQTSGQIYCYAVASGRTERNIAVEG